jgi:predicted RND superfamily exporter protein
MFEEIWLIPLGFIAGILGSIIGLGGGIIIVPVLTFMGFSPTLAVSNSLFAVFSNSVGATAVYAKQKRIEFSLGWKLGLIAVPGTILGAIISSDLSPEIFKILLALVLLSSVSYILLKRKIKEKPLDVSRMLLVFSAGATIVLIGLFGISKVVVDVNMSKFFKPGTEIRDTMDFMDEKMAGTLDIRVRVEGDMKDPQTLSSMRTLQKKMEDNAKVITSFSIANVVEQMHRTVMDDNPEYETVPDNREKVNNLFTVYSMSGDLDDFSSMVDYDYETGLITAFSKVMSTDEIFAFVEEMNGHVKTAMDRDLIVDFTGMIVILRDLVIMVVRSSALSIIFSLIIIGIIASIFFKRILWGTLAVIPLTSAVIINFGFMGFFGIELSHITAILSSIIIGVGVDFAVHYIAQFRRLSRTVDASKLSREVVDDVGYPIILDAGSNMGFGALLFSTFVPIQYIGGLMVFAMVSTSIGTLTVLSALAEMLKQRLIERNL